MAKGKKKTWGTQGMAGRPPVNQKLPKLPRMWAPKTPRRLVLRRNLQLPP